MRFLVARGLAGVGFGFFCVLRANETTASNGGSPSSELLGRLTLAPCVYRTELMPRNGVRFAADEFDVCLGSSAVYGSYV